MEFFKDKILDNKHKEIIEKTRNGVESIEIVPEKEEYNTPLIVAPCWGGDIDSHKKILRSFADNGRHVLSLSHKRKKENVDIPENSIIKDQYIAEIQKAFAINEVIDQKVEENKKVDVVAYSEGGINSLIAAVQNPKKFKNFILLNTAGMVGKDSSLSLVLRFQKQLGMGLLDSLVKGEDIFKNNLLYVKSLIKYIAKNPNLSALEVNAIAQSDIYSMLKYLKEQGIKISVIHGVHDPVFPMERVQDIASNKAQEAGARTSDIYMDGFYSVRGDHGGVLAEPEKYTTLINKALIALENKT